MNIVMKLGGKRVSLHNIQTASSFVPSNGCIPADWFRGTFSYAIKKYKLRSPEWIVEPDMVPIKFDRYVVQSLQVGAQVRYRPVFINWEADVPVTLVTSSVDDFLNVVDRAGFAIGIGDRRPHYGRFELVAVTVDGHPYERLRAVSNG